MGKTITACTTMHCAIVIINTISSMVIGSSPSRSRRNNIVVVSIATSMMTCLGCWPIVVESIRVERVDDIYQIIKLN